MQPCAWAVPPTARIICLIIYAPNQAEYLLYDLLASLISDPFHTPVNIVTLCMSYFIKWMTSGNVFISFINHD